MQDPHERSARLPPEDQEGRAREILLGKAYHGLQPDERRTGKAAKLIDLYARINSITAT
jgi:hypothetical protein